DSHLTSPIGTWNMSNAAAISYAVNNGQATIGPHCWQTKGSKLCLPKQAVIGKAGDVNVALQHFDVNTINKFTGDSLRLRVVVTGVVEASWAEGQTIPLLNANVGSKNLHILVRNDGTVLPFNFSDLQLQAKINNNILDLDLLAQLK